MKIKYEYKGITRNSSSRSGNKIKYIVIHETGNVSKGSTASGHIKWLSNNSKANTSAHYYVSATKNTVDILQGTPNYRASWHAGVLHNKRAIKYKWERITNLNTIAIEMCVNRDGNYKNAFKGTIELTKSLMEKLKIPPSRVVSHNEVTGKNCPQIMIAKKLWSTFKKEIEKPMEVSMKLADRVEEYNLNSKKVVKEKITEKNILSNPIAINYNNHRDLRAVHSFQNAFHEAIVTAPNKAKMDWKEISRKGFTIINIGGKGTSYADYIIRGKNADETLSMVKQFTLDIIAKKDLNKYKHS